MSIMALSYNISEGTRTVI